MDMITLAMAKAYADSQRIGYVEPGKVFTYDGGADAEFEDVGSIRTVVLSKDVFDLNKVKKIKCVLADGMELEFARSELTLVDTGVGITSLNATYGTSTLPAVFASTSGGLLGFARKGVGFVSYVEFDETIHPIDPKYLPGVCLPVVELSIGTVIGAVQAGGEPYPLTAEESANFEVAKNSGGAVIVRAYSGEGFYSCCLCTAYYEPSSATFKCQMISGGLTADVVISNNSTNGWSVVATLV